MSLWPKRIAAIAAVATAVFTLQGAEQANSADGELHVALSGDQELDRATYLRLLVSSEAERDRLDDAVLIRALSRREALARRLAAFQLGESEHPNASIISALVARLADADEGVAIQAAAALRRIAQGHPELIATHLLTVDATRDYQYRSERANQSRSLRLSTSDVVVAALAGAHKDAIMPVVTAYRTAKARTNSAVEVTSPTKPALSRSGEAARYLPGTPGYYLRALSILVEVSGAAEPEIVLGLLNDPDSDLRSIARVLTPKLGAAAARAIPVLQAAANAEPDIDERLRLVRIISELIAMQKPQGANDATTPTPPSERDDCSSAVVATAVASADPAAKTAAVQALRRARSDFDYACLVPLVADTSIDTATRERAAALIGAGGSAMEESRREGVALALLSALPTSNSSIEWEVGKALREILQKHRWSNAALVAAILSKSGGNRYSDIACLTRFISPDLLKGDRGVARQMAQLYVSDVEETGEARACLATALGELDDVALRNALSADELIRRLAASTYVSEADESLLARLVDRKLLLKRRRELLANKKDTARLRVADLLARRGVISDDVIAVFAEGLVTTGWQDWHANEAALVGLSHAGDRGLSILKKILRGNGYTPGVTVSLLEKLYWIDPRVRRALRAEVLGATRNVDPKVRAEAARGLHYVIDDPKRLSAELARLGTDANDYVVESVIDSLHNTEKPIALPLVIIERAGWSTNSTLRWKSVDLLAALAKPLPEKALSILRALLIDKDERVRADAIKVTGNLGADGAALIRVQLSGPNAQMLLSGNRNEHTLAQALANIGPPAAEVEIPLMDLARKGDISRAKIFSVLRGLSDVAPGTIDFAVEALASDDAPVRESAIAAILGWRPDPATLPQRAYSSLLDMEVANQYRLHFDKIIDALRPYFGDVPMSGRGAKLPDFPWPPPAWSSKSLLPQEYIGGDAASLGDVSQTLINALAVASPDFEYGLFGNVPGGFALLARLERIYPDGKPYPGLERWSERDDSVAGLRDYIAHLFLAIPGYYRVIAFVVTDQDPQTSSPGKLPDLRVGGKTLPDEIAAQTMQGRQCLALIYTFRRYRGGRIAFGYDGSPSGQTHLILSGIWPSLATRVGGR